MTYELDPKCEICNNIHIYKICWACSTVKEQEAQILEDLKKIKEKFDKDINTLINALTYCNIKEIYCLLSALKSSNISQIPEKLKYFIQKFSRFDYTEVIKSILNDSRLKLSSNNCITQANMLLLDSQHDTDYNYIIYRIKHRKNYNYTTEFILSNLTDDEINKLMEEYPSNFEEKLKQYKQEFVKLLPTVKYKYLHDPMPLDEDSFINILLNNTLSIIAGDYVWNDIIEGIDYMKYINIDERINDIIENIIKIITDPKYDYITEGRLDGEGIFRSKEELIEHEQWLRAGCTLTAIMKQKTVNLFKKGKEDREYMASVMHYDIQLYLYNTCTVCRWSDIIKKVCIKYDKIKHAMTLQSILKSELPIDGLKSIKDLRKNKEKNRSTYTLRTGKHPSIV